MILLAVVIFIGVFSVAAAYLAAGAAPKSVDAAKAARLSMSMASASHAARDISSVVRKETFSAIPWMHQWLVQFELTPLIRLLLYQADLSWTVGGLLLATLAGFSASTYIVWLRTRAFAFSAICGVAVCLLPLAYVFFRRGRRFKKFEEGLPGALDLMVSALRVGQSLNSALSLVSKECQDPIRSEFRICFDEQNYGLELRAAMNNMLVRVPVQDLRLVTTAILIQKESGGNLAEVLEKAAHVTRERFRIKRQVMVHTAQGRLTGWILTALPIGLGIALYLINPTMMSVLWTRPIGIKLLWAAVIMMVVGSLIIRKIVRIEV